MNALEVLGTVNFDWAMRLKQVWTDISWDAPELHSNLRQAFVDRIEEMKQYAGPGGPAPLGWVITGTGGSGKTHLLSVIRREAAARNAGFVLVDMTDVRDFWGTVLQGYIDSLQERYRDDLFQHQVLLRSFVKRLPIKTELGRAIETLANHKSEQLARDLDLALKALALSYRPEAQRYHNVIRALVCLNSADFAISSLGMTFLQGQEIEEDERRSLKFTVRQEPPRKIVGALSWLMSLNGPTVLAFDQLDPIVTQMNVRSALEGDGEQETVARAIIQDIASGLSTLRDTTFQTLAVIACVDNTWDVICNTVMAQYTDRFEPPRRLSSLGDRVVAESVIRTRLAEAFQRCGFVPPYPTWPFQPQAFADLRNDTPREVLKKCEKHRRDCLNRGDVVEVGNFAPPAGGNGDDGCAKRYGEFDRRFHELRQRADPVYLLQEKFEDERLAPLLCTGLACLLHENELPDQVDGVVDGDFSGGKTTKPLHARLRLIFRKENDREEHFCVRALQHAHHAAFQSRLKAAMTQSGIDKALRFRQLSIVRSVPRPGGETTERLTRTFCEAGGVFVQPNGEELRTLFALHQLKQQNDPCFDAWLKAHRPASQLQLLRAIAPSSYFRAEDPASRNPRTAGEQRTNTTRQETTGKEPATVVKEPENVTPPKRPDVTTLTIDPLLFPLGRRLLGNNVGDSVTAPIQGLEKHTLVMAGAGSGKTILLKRLIEEAAVRGIPSIVIDCANDLAALGDPWPEPPAGWAEEDVQKAKWYHRTTEVVVWTPGRNENPLVLQTLPDLAAVADDNDELNAAVDMVREALVPIVAKGLSEKSKKKDGVLASALRFFARHGGGDLGDFVALLNDLPTEAGLGMANEKKLARDMAEILKAEQATNPLLRTAGTPVDPAVLFGDDRPRKATRISVISLVGLPSLESQRYFLNKLAMTLFGWIKKNPNSGRPLRGLLVIDEAKDFVPSQKGSVCKESIMRLAAQARKYHLGVVLATQNPKDIESKIVGNCSTHFYGKANSPASIDVVQEQIQLKGGSGNDIPRLQAGHFYVYTTDAKLPAPVKIYSPLCLSYHPKDPLNQEAILRKAVASRAQLSAG